MLKGDEYKFFLDHINGLMVVNENGRLIYMNRQCADYICVNLEASIGKPVEEVFPPTKMRQFMKESTSPVLQFYFVDGRASASLDVPLKKNGKVVGVLEYDLFEDFEFMEPFLENYKMAADDELRYYREEVKKIHQAKYSIENILGQSDKIKMLKRQIKYAAESASTVLISGETGTGKEQVAHSIHNLGQRCIKAFIRINAASIPENLAESELFGYSEGSFTGAKKGGSKGKFLLADKGTLFIDEIDKMPLSIQPKLLRALQEREIDPIGSEKSIPVDVRIIAASNRDLKKLVEEGLFREDLYYRLNVVEIRTTPLRERKMDIPILVEDFREELNRTMGFSVTRISPGALHLLIDYHWPGNVRELHNVIERAMHYAEGGVLEPEHLSLIIEKKRPFDFENAENPIENAKREAEISVIRQALSECHYNKTHAAKRLKISRALLYQKMRRLNLLDASDHYHR